MADHPGLRRYWAVALGLAGVFLLVFIIARAAGLELEDPQPLLAGGGAVAALVSVALLTVDGVAPIPASLVMLANGWLFGAALGALVSTIGGLLAFAVGFALGRRGDAMLTRFVGPQQRIRADALLDQHGPLALAISRPVPILAETVSILAGASKLTWVKATLAALTGIIPQAIIYGLAGAAVASFESGVVSFLVLVALAVLAWVIAPRIATTVRARKSP